MAEELYCWRCGVEMPMLDENEWTRMQPHLHAALVRRRFIISDDQHLLVESGLPAFAVVLDVAHDELAGVVDRRLRHAYLLLVQPMIYRRIGKKTN